MSDKDLKPWQIASDGDPEPAQPSAMDAPVFHLPEPDVAPAPPADPGLLTRLPVTSSWALVPLGAALLAILSLDYILPAESFHVDWRVRSSLSALLGVAFGVLVFSHIVRKQSIDRLMAGIRHGAVSTGPGNVVSPEVRPMVELLEHHIQVVQQKTSELVDQNRQLQLDFTLAETRRLRQLAIIDAMVDPIVATDSYDQVIFMNPAAGELLGCDVKESTRKPIAELIDNSDVLKLIKSAREADARASDRRIELSKDEEIYDVFATALGRDTESESHGVLCVFKDVTREKTASRKKSEFVSHVAHELRTPLSSIRAYVEMLVDGEAEDEAAQKEYYDIIQTSAERLGRLIDNMLNISRIEAGTVRINREPQAVSIIVKEAVDTMRPSAEEKKIKLIEHLTPVIYQVEADRDLILQAVLNLISNAIKYTPDGGEVVVQMTADEGKGRVVIDVVDTGVGIPEEDLPRMFEKFFRVERNKNVAKGTGLGLNLVKRIVEDVHGGQIALRSEVGKGSTFSIALPLS